MLIYFCVKRRSKLSAYMYSSGINCVVVHIIQVNGEYCSMPVQKTTVALHFDPENRKLKKIKAGTS